MEDTPTYLIESPEFDEVSCVDKGDNPHAKIVLWKRASDATDASEDGEELLTDEEIEKAIVDFDVPLDKGWDESLHPRAAGKFAAKSGGSKKEAPTKDKAKGQKGEEGGPNKIAREKLRAAIDANPKLKSHRREMMDMMDTAASGDGSDEIPGLVDKSSIPDEAKGDAKKVMVDAMLDEAKDETKAVSKVGRKISNSRMAQLKSALSALQAIISEQEAGDSNDKDSGGADKKASSGASEYKKTSKREEDKLTPVDRDALVAKLDQDELAHFEALEAQASEDGGTENTDPIQKAMEQLPEEVRKAWEEDREQARLDREEVSKIREERELGRIREEVAKLRNVSADKEELPEILRRIEKGESTKEDFDAIVKHFGAYDKMVGDSAALLREVGKRGPSSAETNGSGDAASELKKKAQEIQDADPNLSGVDAMKRARRDNPELLRKYHQERDTAVR